MKRGKTPFVVFAGATFLIAVLIVAGMMILYNPGTWADPSSWKNLGVTMEESLRAAKNSAETFASGIWASNSGRTIPERLESYIGK